MTSDILGILYKDIFITDHRLNEFVEDSDEGSDEVICGTFRMLNGKWKYDVDPSEYIVITEENKHKYPEYLI